MNKVGIYYAYWTHDWNAAFLPYVAKVKRLGFDLLEVNSGTVTRMTVLDRKMCLPGPAIAGFDPDWMVSQGLGASKTRLSKQDGRI